MDIRKGDVVTFKPKKMKVVDVKDGLVSLATGEGRSDNLFHVPLHFLDPAPSDPEPLETPSYPDA